MSIQRLAGRACLGMAFPIAVLCLGLTSGCGGSDTSVQQAAPLSPEAEKKQNEMLANYGQNYHEQFRAAKASKKKK